MSLSKYLKEFVNMFSKFCYDVPHFGIKIAHYNFRGQFANSGFLPRGICKFVKNKRLRLITHFLNQEFKLFINSYDDKQLSLGINNKKIWVLWWQGADDAPDIVKICIDSIKHHSCGYDIVLLDKDNYNKYIKLPDFIIKKVEDKKITITHLSDIIRMGLLKEYGGIWIDATMFVSGNVFEKFNDIDLNTNYPQNYVDMNFGFEKWTGFFIGGKSNKLFHFVYDFLIEYHKRFEYILNYFLIDYVIHLAYLNFDECKNDIDNITLKNNEIFSLVECFNNKYDKDKYDKLMKNGFFKLTYKRQFIIHDKNGNITNYGKFVEDNKPNLKK